MRVLSRTVLSALAKHRDCRRLCYSVAALHTYGKSSFHLQFHGSGAGPRPAICRQRNTVYGFDGRSEYFVAVRVSAWRHWLRPFQCDCRCAVRAVAFLCTAAVALFPSGSVEAQPD